MRSKLLYEIRIAFGFASLMPLLILPVYALISVTQQAARAVSTKIPLQIELVLPLAAGLCAAHLMSIEREERFHELRHTYPEPSWHLPLLRALGAFVGVAACLLVSFVILHVRYPTSGILEASLPAIAPALYLLGVALLTNNITGSYWFSAALIALYWFLEYQSRGQLTRHCYLFDYTFPIDFVNYELNRLTLLAMALVCFILNFACSIWRRGRGG